MFSLAGQPITVQQAEMAAAEWVTNQVTQAQRGIDCQQEDDFIHCVVTFETPDRYLVVLHQPTGQRLFGGLEKWADETNRGFDFPPPAGFKDAAAIGCVAPIAEPQQKKFVTTGTPSGSGIASLASDALDVARKLNISQLFVANRPYRAFVISYAPAVGEFDPAAADWYIWLYIP